VDTANVDLHRTVKYRLEVQDSQRDEQHTILHAATVEAGTGLLSSNACRCRSNRPRSERTKLMNSKYLSRSMIASYATSQPTRLSGGFSGSIILLAVASRGCGKSDQSFSCLRARTGQWPSGWSGWCRTGQWTRSATASAPASAPTSGRAATRNALDGAERKWGE